MSEMFYDPNLERGRIRPMPSAPEVVEALHAFLNDETLRAEILAGNVTLAMVRPAIYEGAHLEPSDLERAQDVEGEDPQAAAALEAHIMRLGYKAKFSIWFDREAITEFYAEPKERMLASRADKDPGYSNKWEEFSDLMLSGPTTILLLYSPHGNAIQLWREQIGHWDIINQRDPNTLRGRFGIDNYNNLAHGSDSPEAVLREIGIIQRLLERQASSNR